MNTKNDIISECLFCGTKNIHRENLDDKIWLYQCHGCAPYEASNMIMARINGKIGSIGNPIASEIKREILDKIITVYQKTGSPLKLDSPDIEILID